MKNLIAVLKIPIIIILTFILQIVVANNFEIFGVTPNLILVTLVIMSMWNPLKFNIVIACVLGLLTDCIFRFDLGYSLITYLIIALCISYISGKYRKESKTAIVYITIIATCIFVGFQFIYYMIESSLVINIFAILKQLIIEILLNIAIAYIVYKLFEKSMKKDEINSFYS